MRRDEYGRSYPVVRFVVISHLLKRTPPHKITNAKVNCQSDRHSGKKTCKICEKGMKSLLNFISSMVVVAALATFVSGSSLGANSTKLETSTTSLRRSTRSMGTEDVIEQMHDHYDPRQHSELVFDVTQPVNRV